MTPGDHALTYVGTGRIDGPLLVVEKPHDVGFDETVEIQDPAGNFRLGRVLEISDREAVVQVLEGTEGLSNDLTRVRFLGRTLELPVAEEMLIWIKLEAEEYLTQINEANTFDDQLGEYIAEAINAFKTVYKFSYGV